MVLDGYGRNEGHIVAADGVTGLGQGSVVIRGRERLQVGETHFRVEGSGTSGVQVRMEGGFVILSFGFLSGGRIL